MIKGTIKRLSLSKTTFQKFIDYCEREEKHWHTKRQYVTIPKLKIIYDYYVKHGMECNGRQCHVTVKSGVGYDSHFVEPLEYEPTREDFMWAMFHEVYWKTEWAVRCTKTPREIGYDVVKADFGTAIIKALKEA